MKKAIITGATGLLGQAVASHFSSNGIETLCLGTSVLDEREIHQRFGPKANYLSLPMKDIGLLVEKIQQIAWTPGDDCVFFHFAWRGRQRLTDGDFSDQLNNAIYASEAVKSSKQIGCVKFVNVGTIQESLAEQYIKSDCLGACDLDQVDYALAKLASRDMCKMIAYLEKIDYVHTRLSVPLAPDLSRGGYIASTLKKILEGSSYEAPASKHLFDIVFTDDVADVYLKIGHKGKNKADYYIGAGKPDTLGGYFKRFESLVTNEAESVVAPAALEGGVFDSKPLLLDVGISLDAKFEKIINTL